MTKFKKVVAIIVMALAVIGMILCLAGIIGGWVINAPLTRDVVALLTGVSKTLQVADSALTDASDGVAIARGVVGQVQSITASGGGQLEGSKVDQLATLVQGKLSDAVATIERAYRTIVGTVEAVNGVIATVNRFPGVQIKPLDTVEIDKLTGLITDISGTLKQVVGGIEAVRSGVGNAVATLTEAVDRLDNRLGGLLGAIGQIQAKIREALASVNAVIVRLPGLIDLLSVALTVLLLWLGFAQLGLFMWMRSIHKSL
jgi:hypothetical protein